MDDGNSHERISERVVECLEDVSFVANSIHLWLEERVVHKSCAKYFAYELSNCCYNRYLMESTWTWVKGMTTTIGCAGVVSVSTSCGRYCNLI